MSGIRIVERGSMIEATLTRPEKRNALNLEMLEGLFEATARLAGGDHLQVLLVRSEGEVFSAGIDLNSELAPDPAIASPTAFRRWYRAGKGCLHPLGDLWEATEKPIVVAHHGPCIGGALELSLCADFRLASDTARYRLPEIAMGGLPGSGGMSRLVRTVGSHWARWLVLAGLDFDAERALAIGLVHSVTPAAQFSAEVDRFCDHLAAIPREAYAAGKLALELMAEVGRGDARSIERLAVSGLATGAEYHAVYEEYVARFRKDPK
ncbi:enoyl-CoA hydratase/isomerase family protein [Novosphingobium lentum]|uniref:enoyl-CoA hydratase/isomerase family protein n=1 Tax=Novosphingobium lentum TaxID=145287 RepID=UPI000ACF949D|nr:enoyl-CoA hydratase/isomerase family protein [Novosphingobium lentum]